MRNQREAGLKADAHHVIALYRASFGAAKEVARRRQIESLRAAGCTVVIDLWGGGAMCDELVAAGFRVIAVEDGSMNLIDERGRKVSPLRKKRALEYAAREGGYEWRWGKVEKYAHEADGACLDFCGPWSKITGRTVAACRHMKAVLVTLTPDHDKVTEATSSFEREMIYQLLLKLSWADKPRWESMMARGGVRRLLVYRRARGYAVYLYLLTHKPVSIPRLTPRERERTSPAIHQRHLAVKRAWYHNLSPEKKRAQLARNDRERRERWRADPEQGRLLWRHAYHKKAPPVRNRRKPCPLCESEGRLGPASPA